jgi:hypothetical protein
MIGQEILYPPGTLEVPHHGRLPRGWDFTTKIPREPLPFGRLGVRGAADGTEQVRLPTTSADVTTRVRGIVVNLSDPVLGNPVPPVGVDTGTPATLIRRGLVRVYVETPVSQDAQAYARFAAGPGGSELGAIRQDADSGTAAPIPHSRFTTDARRCAVLDLNL